MAAIIDFYYKKKFNFPTDSVTISGAVADFPHCVHINSSSWSEDERNYFFGEWNVNGKRCQFFDKDGNNLPYDVDHYSAVNKEAGYWVKKSVASGDDGTNNYIYVGFGNDPNDEDQDSATNVWKSAFKLVAHLNDLTTSTTKDSTSNANNGSKKGANEPLEANGQVYKGQDFDGTDDYIAFPDQNYYTFGNGSTDSPFSIFASIKMDDASNFRIMAKAYTTTTAEYNFFVNSTDYLGIALYGAGNTAKQINRISNNTLTGYEGTFIRVAVTYDGSKSNSGLKLYLNGSVVASTGGGAGIYGAMGDYNSGINVGAALRGDNTYKRFANGVIDEARLIAEESSADWIKLDHYSTKKTNWNGDSWYSWGPVEGGVTQSIERDAILHGIDRYDIERDSILHGIDTYDVERDIILKGLADIERDAILRGRYSLDRDLILRGMYAREKEIDAILRGFASQSLERDFILDGQIESARDFILRGLTGLERDFIISGVSHLDKGAWFMLTGQEAKDNGQDFILKGLNGFGRDFIIPAMPNIEAAFIIRGEEILPAWKTKRLTLLDTLNLRTTAVYRNPRDISVLQIVVGDYMNSKIPCTQLDRDGYMHHVSDRAMQLIDKVYADNEPVGYGYRAYTAYQDETGRRIACVIFDNPQYDKKISVTGKGAFRTDSPAAELIENPADLIRFVFLDVQGYDASSIDLAELLRFYADGLAGEMKVAALLNDFRTIKAFLDELADNIHSQWMISDGKSVMRYRWL